MVSITNINEQHNKFFQKVMKYYNKALFQGKLKKCCIRFSDDVVDQGIFIPDVWIEEEKKNAHLIVFTPDILNDESKELHLKIMHNLIHVWQYENGSPAPDYGHNEEWVKKAEELGIMCILEE